MAPVQNKSKSSHALTNLGPLSELLTEAKTEGTKRPILPQCHCDEQSDRKVVFRAAHAACSCDKPNINALGDALCKPLALYKADDPDPDGLAVAGPHVAHA